MSRITKYIKDPILIWLLVDKYLFRISSKRFITSKYYQVFRCKPNLKNPQTFNEKLQWLKLYDKKEIYTNMVDKYLAKEYVKKIIGEEYIIPTIGVYDKLEDVDFSKLPKEYVLKTTHYGGSKGVYVIKNGKIPDNMEKTIHAIMKENLYYYGREWPYKNVKPRIIIEKYMVDKQLKELRDYKFFCFNGVPKFFKIDFDRFNGHKANYYDLKGKILPFGEVVCPPDFNKKLDMPKNLDKMIELATKLSNNIAFLRVDFYEINGKVYFGELTFYPASGIGKFMPCEWDKKIGNMLNLENVEKG